MNWWESDRFSLSWQKELDKKTQLCLEWLTKEFSNKSQARIGILGFGFGREAKAISKQFSPSLELQLLGFDINQTRFSQAQQKMSDQALAQTSFICASIHEIPVADNSLDATVCLETMMHADNFAQALSELIRTTKPNGYIVFNCNISHGPISDYLRFLLTHGPLRSFQRLKERIFRTADNSAIRTYFHPEETLEKLITNLDSADLIQSQSFLNGLDQVFVLQKRSS